MCHHRNYNITLDGLRIILPEYHRLLIETKKTGLQFHSASRSLADKSYNAINNWLLMLLQQERDYARKVFITEHIAVILGHHADRITVHNKRVRVRNAVV